MVPLCSNSVSQTHSEPKLDHKQKHAGDFSHPSYLLYQQEEISVADIDVLVGFNTVNIQEQARYHHLKEVSPSQIPSKYFTDWSLPFLMQLCLDSIFYFAND